MTLEQLSADWTAGWNHLWTRTQEVLAPNVHANPKAYEGDVAAFVQALQAARSDLDRMKAALAPAGNRPEDFAHFNRLARQHYELASRFYADTQQASQTQLGFVPLLVVAGLAVGVAGSAWAVGAFQYATNLREQTALAARELDARIAASKEGRALQPTTLPTPPPADSPSTLLKQGGKLVGAGLLVVAGLFLLPQLMGRK